MHTQYPSSDPDRTVTTHHVGYLWNPEFIEDLTTGLRDLTKEMIAELDLSADCLSKEDDSKLLFWAPELTFYNESLMDEMVKCDRSTTKYKELVKGREATPDDVRVTRDLVSAWKELVEAFRERVSQHQVAQERARLNPSPQDLVAIEALGGECALESPEFYFDDFDAYANHLMDLLRDDWA